MPQRRRHPTDRRVDRRRLVEIDQRDAQMVGMVKAFVRQVAALQHPRQLGVSHIITISYYSKMVKEPRVLQMVQLGAAAAIARWVWSVRSVSFPDRVPSGCCLKAADAASFTVRPAAMPRWR